VFDVERDKPIRPEPPPMPQPASRRSLVPVVMVVVPLAIFIAGIAAFTGKAGLLILAVIACVPAFVMLHYLLWGYWLGRSLREAQQRERERDETE
jgi:hypothetical protein